MKIYNSIMLISRPLRWSLLSFAAIAVASIALQNVLLGLIALVFLWEKFKEPDRFPWPRNPFLWATLLFLISFYLGSLVGVDLSESFKTVHKYLALLILFVIGAIPLSFSDLKRSIQTLVWGGAFCALYGIFYGHFILHLDRITSFSGDKMVFGGMLMVCLLLQLWLLKQKPQDLWGWASLFVLGIALVMTETRGSWLGFVAGFLLLVWKWDRKWLWVGLAVLLLVPFLLPSKWKDRLSNTTHIWVAYDSAHRPVAANETRVLIWMAGWEMIKDHPWGVGQGNVSNLFPKYVADTPMARSEPNIPHLHNNYLQILAQNGWQGLIIYGIWIWTFGWMVFNFRSSDPVAQEMNWVLFSAFVAVLIWGLTEYTFSHQFMNFQFFLLGLQTRLWELNRRSDTVKGSKGRKTRPSK